MTSQAIRAFTALHESSSEATVKTHSQLPGPSALPSRAIDPLMPPIDVLEEEEQEKRERMKKRGEVNSWGNEAESTESMWCEAKSDDGHTYYWNVKTGGKINLFSICPHLSIDFFLLQYFQIQSGKCQKKVI